MISLRSLINENYCLRIREEVDSDIRIIGSWMGGSASVKFIKDWRFRMNFWRVPTRGYRGYISYSMLKLGKKLKSRRELSECNKKYYFARHYFLFPLTLLHNTSRFIMQDYHMVTLYDWRVS